MTDKIEILKGNRGGTFGYEYPILVNGELYTVCRNLTDAIATVSGLSK